MTDLIEPTDLLEVPRLSLWQIRVHPSNPRINATADDEMVESIRQQGVLEPLMVAPAEDGDGWVLIDGHRRHDGAVKADVDDVPVNPRYDLVTEVQQVEVMAVTGLQKQLLTPVEEAPAYEQLTLLGMDAAAIATSTGFSQARVKSRMRLTTLSDQVRTSVHEGQMTLGDAEALLEFAEDPKVTADLEASVGTNNFRFKVQEARSRRDRLAARDLEATALRDRGAQEVVLVPGRPGYVIDANKVGDESAEVRAASLMSFSPDLQDRDAHDGCLGFEVPDWDYGQVRVLCIDPDRHPTDDDDSDQPGNPVPTVVSDWEAGRPAREAEQARQAAAAAVRLEWLVEHFAGMFPTKSHQPLAAAAQAMLPLLVTDSREVMDPAVVAAAYGLDGTTAATEAYADQVSTAKPTAVLAGFGSYLAAMVADFLATDSLWVDEPVELRRHLTLWDWLKKAGYQMSDVDTAIRTRLETKLAARDDQ